VEKTQEDSTTNNLRLVKNLEENSKKFYSKSTVNIFFVPKASVLNKIVKILVEGLEKVKMVCSDDPSQSNFQKSG
jgi:hypothetical protein